MRSGDKETNLTFCGGSYLTSSSKEIAFTLPLRKRLDNVNPVVTKFKAYVRIPTGGYLIPMGSYLSDLDCNLYYIKDSNFLTVRIVFNTAFSSVPNNIPLGIQLDELDIEFR